MRPNFHDQSVAPAVPWNLGRARTQVRDALLFTWKTAELVWRSSKSATITLALVTLLSAVLPLGIAYAGKGIVDGVVAGSSRDTLRWVLIELCVVGAQVLAQRTLGYLRQLLGARLGVDVNVMILEKASSLSLRHFEDGRFYDSLTRARREASFRPISVVTEGFQLAQNLLTLLGYLGLVLSYSRWAGLALLAASLPLALVEMHFSKSVFRLRNWRSPEARQLNYLEYVLANDGHAKEVKLFGLGRTLLERYRGVAEKIFREDQALARKRAGWALLLSLLGTGAFYGCYAGMALAAATHRITLGRMTLYLVAFRQGQQAFQSVLSAISGIYENTLYMSNLFEYLAISDLDSVVLPREAARAPAPGPAVLSSLSVHAEGEAERLGAEGMGERMGAERMGAERVGAEGIGERGIRFENVGFSYPAKATPGQAGGWALRNVDLFIPPGQSVALVGRNGAGKTTLIKLLTRLYQPSEGRILLDGLDLRAWDPERLKARIAVIFQDFNQYQFDVRENIAVGSLPHANDDARIWRAATRSGADEVVAELSDGLPTKLGKWAHDGVELSGGQWQKIALGRAFMREEADILVLDEPTAALDAEAEHAVFERFRTLAQDRTTFLISHRFSTVRRADRILVIDQGRLVEDGSHEQLLAAGRDYARLFRLQAQGYQDRPGPAPEEPFATEPEEKLAVSPLDSGRSSRLARVK